MRQDPREERIRPSKASVLNQSAFNVARHTNRNKKDVKAAEEKVLELAKKQQEEQRAMKQKHAEQTQKVHDALRKAVKKYIPEEWLDEQK